MSVIREMGNDKCSWHGHSDLTLIAANYTPIHMCGSGTILLNFSRHHFAWNFTIADVPLPRLGADFLQANNFFSKFEKSEVGGC